MNEDLKPCPMCGGEAHLTKGHCVGPQWPGEFHRVYCGSCQLRQLFYSTPSEAVSAWNRRPSASIADTAGAKPVTLSAEQEKERFEAVYRHLDLSQQLNAWNVPVYSHSHVQALWQGWLDRSAAPPAPSVADAAGARTTLNYDGTVDITCAHCGGNGCFACLRKESGND